MNDISNRLVSYVSTVVGVPWEDSQLKILKSSLHFEGGKPLIALEIYLRVFIFISKRQCFFFFPFKRESAFLMKRNFTWRKTRACNLGKCAQIPRRFSREAHGKLKDHFSKSLSSH